MTSFQIIDLKNFMTKLLGSDTFDSFLLEEAMVTTYNTFIIDGHINDKFYTSEELADPAICPYTLSTWSSMRVLCFNLIKGKKTPTGFKFVLHLMPQYVSRTLANSDVNVTVDIVKALILNIKYDGNVLNIVTATSFDTFVLDKSLDKLWDHTVRQFLTKHDIEFEESI